MASDRRARRQTIRTEGTTVERKQCADCGQPSLQDELRCWACGGSRFESDDAKLAGEPTICLGQAREVTASWSRPRSIPTAPLYVLCGAACALFTCVVGYWVGRASVPGAPLPAPKQQAAVVQPVTLPTPPTALAIPSSGSYASSGGSGSGGAATSIYDPAVVTVRPKSTPGASGARPFAPPAAAPPQPAIFGNPLVQPRQSSQVVTQDVMPPARAAVTSPTTPSPVQSAPTPSASTAVVMLRNSASVAVEVAIEGPEQWTAVVAPGSAIPVTLSPGSYQLRATGDGARSRRSTLALAANRTYSLVVDRRRDGDREALVLIEPAVDGQAD
jgi:hypothetical protein